MKGRYGTELCFFLRPDCLQEGPPFRETIPLLLLFGVLLSTKLPNRPWLPPLQSKHQPTPKQSFEVYTLGTTLGTEENVSRNVRRNVGMLGYYSVSRTFLGMCGSTWILTCWTVTANLIAEDSPHQIYIYIHRSVSLLQVNTQINTQASFQTCTPWANGPMEMNRYE